MDAKFVMVFLMAVVYVCIDASPAKLFYRKGTVSTLKNLSINFDFCRLQFLICFALNVSNTHVPFEIRISTKESLLHWQIPIKSIFRMYVNYLYTLASEEGEVFTMIRNLC